MEPGGGKGGKSLELMQKRLKGGGQPTDASSGQQQQPQSQPPQQQQQQQQPQVNQNGRPGKSAASLMATQAREQAAATQIAPPQQPVAPSRPKGKDFAAMAMSVGAAKPKGAPAQSAPQPSAPAAPTRPKGKDFSAMANRMGAPSQPPTQQPPIQQPPMQQPVPAPMMGQGARKQANVEMEERAKLRAQQMQDAARAAAGLPPLARGTSATNPIAKTNASQPPSRGIVATQPTPTQQPQQNVRALPPQQHMQHRAQVPQQQTQRGQIPQQNMVKAQAPQRNLVKAQASQRKQNIPRQPTGGPAGRNQASSTAPAQRRYNNSTQRTQPKLPTEHPAPEIKATPAPHPQEGRLSYTAIKPAAVGPHAAPLVGQRIQDLVKSIDPHFTIDSEAEEQVLQLADDFLDKVIQQGLRMANHRGSKSLDVKDLQLVLAKHWGIVVPGLGLPSIRSSKPGKQTAQKAGGNANAGTGLKRKASDSGVGPKKKPTLAAGSMPSSN